MKNSGRRRENNGSYKKSRKKRRPERFFWATLMITLPPIMWHRRHWGAIKSFAETAKLSPLAEGKL